MESETEDQRIEGNIVAVWKALEERNINSVSELLPTFMTILYSIRKEMTPELQKELDAHIHYGVDMFEELPDAE